MVLSAGWHSSALLDFFALLRYEEAIGSEWQTILQASSIFPVASPSFSQPPLIAVCGLRVVARGVGDEVPRGSSLSNLSAAFNGPYLAQKCQKVDLCQWRAYLLELSFEVLLDECYAYLRLGGGDSLQTSTLLYLTGQIHIRVSHR